MNQKLISLNELKKMLPEMFMARQVVEVEPALDLRAGLQPELQFNSTGMLLSPFSADEKLRRYSDEN
jgi:hypothetical protein